MLDTLITSKTRLKLLLKFFVNPESKGYLRSLESEFGESTNGIRLELNRFESGGMLTSRMEGNKKVFQANTQHPLFFQLQKIIHSYIGLDKIIETVVKNLGQIHHVYLVGDFARGIDTEVIDLVLIGKVDTSYLKKLINKAEALISRKVSYTIFPEEVGENFPKEGAPCLLLWSE